MSDIDKAEQLGRKRALILMVMGLMLPLLQLSYLDQPGAAPPPPHRLFLWSFVVLCMLVVLITGGGFGLGRKVRHLVNDESARANRDIAVRLGFAAAVLTALAIIFYANHHPVTGQLAAQLIITAGLTVAALCYGVLEWRGHRLG